MVSWRPSKSEWSKKTQIKTQQTISLQLKWSRRQSNSPHRRIDKTIRRKDRKARREGRIVRKTVLQRVSSRRVSTSSLGISWYIDIVSMSQKEVVNINSIILILLIRWLNSQLFLYFLKPFFWPFRHLHHLSQHIRLIPHLFNVLSLKLPHLYLYRFFDRILYLEDRLSIFQCIELSLKLDLIPYHSSYSIHDVFNTNAELLLQDRWGRILLEPFLWLIFRLDRDHFLREAYLFEWHLIHFIDLINYYFLMSLALQWFIDFWLDTWQLLLFLPILPFRILDFWIIFLFLLLYYFKFTKTIWTATSNRNGSFRLSLYFLLCLNLSLLFFRRWLILPIFH